MRITQQEVANQIKFYHQMFGLIDKELKRRSSIIDKVGTGERIPTTQNPFANVITDDLLAYKVWMDQILNSASKAIDNNRPPKEVAEILSYADNFFIDEDKEKSGFPQEMPYLLRFKFKRIAQEKALVVLKPKLRRMKILHYSKLAATVIGLGTLLYLVLRFAH